MAEQNPEIASLELQKASIKARYRTRIDRLKRELKRELDNIDKIIYVRQQLEKHRFKVR